MKTTTSKSIKVQNGDAVEYRERESPTGTWQHAFMITGPKDLSRVIRYMRENPELKVRITHYLN
jgi:hypothetical protein